MVVMANNSRLPIAYIGKRTIVPRYGHNEVSFQGLYNVPCMKKNPLSVT